MTPKQRAMLQAIRDLTRQGVPPTYEELRERLGLASKSGVHRLIVQLVAKGLVTTPGGRGSHRTVRVIEPDGPSDGELDLMTDRSLQRLAARVEAAIARKWSKAA